MASSADSRPFTLQFRLGAETPGARKWQLKTYVFPRDARERMLAGVNILADAVEGHARPKGRNVVIDNSFGAPRITKDGVHRRQGDRAFRQVREHGRADGARSRLQDKRHRRRRHHDRDGFWPRPSSRKATSRSRPHEPDGPQARHRSGRVGSGRPSAPPPRRSRPPRKSRRSAPFRPTATSRSANMIAEAMQKVGNEGVITVRGSQDRRDGTRGRRGQQFDRGYLSPYFVTNPDKMGRRAGRRLHPAPREEALQPAGHAAGSEAVGRPPTAPQHLGRRRRRGSGHARRQQAAWRPEDRRRQGSGLRDRRKAKLEDIAILTGGQVISEDLGIKLENVGLNMLGRAKKVSISKETPPSSTAPARSRRSKAASPQIKQQIEETTSDYDKEKLQERLAKLAGGVAVIRVGGANRGRGQGEEGPRRRRAERNPALPSEEGIVCWRRRRSPARLLADQGQGRECRPGTPASTSFARPAGSLPPDRAERRCGSLDRRGQDPRQQRRHYGYNAQTG